MIITERIPDPQKKLDECIDIPIEPFNWRAYNNSQMREKIMFLKLLDDLCQMIDDDKYSFRGRKPTSFSHQVFCMCLKVYLGTSSRRLISDLELCREKRYIDCVPHFNSVCNYFNNKNIKFWLKNLIELSALPLGELEDKFAIDATGFSQKKYADRWSMVRQTYSRHREYKKAHCIYGTYSNTIVAVKITEGNSNDSPHFRELLKRASENFDIKEISADKGYSSRENHKIAEELGITPFILFKKNSLGNSKGAMIWNKMYKYFKNNKEEFLRHYHMRSNSESGFFMIKQKFGGFVNSKNSIAQENEILCKILCHNICVLIQEIYLSNVSIDFLSCAKKHVAQQ